MIGLYLEWRALRAGSACSGRQGLGLMLAGWGAFNLVEASSTTTSSKIHHDHRRTRPSVPVGSLVMAFRSIIDSPPGAPPPAGVYSHAVVSGGFAFLAGQVPERPGGGMLKGAIGEETALCLDNLEAVCAAAGGRLRDAVRVGVYLTDLPADFVGMNAAYTAWFGGGFPARTTIGVTALAAGARIEIDAVVPLLAAPEA